MFGSRSQPGSMIHSVGRLQGDRGQSKTTPPGPIPCTLGWNHRQEVLHEPPAKQLHQAAHQQAPDRGYKHGPHSMIGLGSQTRNDACMVAMGHSTRIDALDFAAGEDPELKEIAGADPVSTTVGSSVSTNHANGPVTSTGGTASSLSTRQRHHSRRLSPYHNSVVSIRPLEECMHPHQVHVGSALPQTYSGCCHQASQNGSFERHVGVEASRVPVWQGNYLNDQKFQSEYYFADSGDGYGGRHPGATFPPPSFHANSSHDSIRYARGDEMGDHARREGGPSWAQSRPPEMVGVTATPTGNTTSISDLPTRHPVASLRTSSVNAESSPSSVAAHTYSTLTRDCTEIQRELAIAAVQQHECHLFYPNITLPAECFNHGENERLRRRLEQRRKQIAYGKDTVGYHHYRTVLPRVEDREFHNPMHPMTPRPENDCSKRTFDKYLNTWRRQLHQWTNCDVNHLTEEFIPLGVITLGDLGLAGPESVAPYGQSPAAMQSIANAAMSRKSPLNFSPESRAAQASPPFSANNSQWMCNTSPHHTLLSISSSAPLASGRVGSACTPCRPEGPEVDAAFFNLSNSQMETPANNAGTFHQSAVPSTNRGTPFTHGRTPANPCTHTPSNRDAVPIVTLLHSNFNLMSSSARGSPSGAGAASGGMREGSCSPSFPHQGGTPIRHVYPSESWSPPHGHPHQGSAMLPASHQKYHTQSRSYRGNGYSRPWSLHDGPGAGPLFQEKQPVASVAIPQGNRQTGSHKSPQGAGRPFMFHSQESYVDPWGTSAYHNSNGQR